MSGRSLRRLPVLALAHSLGLSQTAAVASLGSTAKGSIAPFEMGVTEVESWIAGMDAIVDQHGDEIQRLV